MILQVIAAAYVILSAVLYFAMRIKCRKNAVFTAPKSKFAFYFLSLTWGAPKTITGALAALALRLTGHRTVKYGPAWCFELPGIDWGLELGLFFIAPEGGDERIKAHELGHGIQNIYFGIFTPLVVSLPSAIRFRYRRIRKRKGRPCKSGYDEIWFERSATESGMEYMRTRIGKKEQ